MSSITPVKGKYDTCTECKDVISDAWICLNCQHVGCGRYSKKHAEEHYNANKSHEIVANL